MTIIYNPSGIGCLMKENDELKKLLNTLYGVNMELELKLTRMESMENCNKYIRDMCPK